MPTSETLRHLLDDVLAPAHFFIAPTLRVVWDRCAETNVSWELFQGRLLDAAHTRQRRSFASWNLFALTGEGRAAEPLLSLKLDADAGEVHVVRGLDCYTWEGYDAGGGVFLSREVRKWVRELAGTVRLDRFALLDELRHELVCQVSHAVVGASRLPLASVETPLPQFSLGQLFYCYRPYAGVRDRQLESYRDLSFWMLTKHTAWLVRGRLLETFLHAVPFAEMDAAVDHFVRCWATHSQGEKGVERNLATLLRTLFNNVSLSPYTDLVDKTLAFVRALEKLGTISPATAADFLGHLLRQNGRHLTAYDLVTFHHRGANYPDALLLDAVLKDYLARIEQQPNLFNGTTDDARRRRRALRQGYLLHRRYENHPVPDQPTSPGENMRVLPIPAYRTSNSRSRTVARNVSSPTTRCRTTSRRMQKRYCGRVSPTWTIPKSCANWAWRCSWTVRSAWASRRPSRTRRCSCRPRRLVVPSPMSACDSCKRTGC